MKLTLAHLVAQSVLNFARHSILSPLLTLLGEHRGAGTTARSYSLMTLENALLEVTAREQLRAELAAITTQHARETVSHMLESLELAMPELEGWDAIVAFGGIAYIKRWTVGEFGNVYIDLDSRSPGLVTISTESANIRPLMLPLTHPDLPLAVAERMLLHTETKMTVKP